MKGREVTKIITNHHLESTNVYFNVIQSRHSRWLALDKRVGEKGRVQSVLLCVGLAV